MAIVKRGTRYYAVVIHNGRQVWRAGGTSERSAKKVEAELVSQIARGEYRELKRATFNQFQKMWWTDYASVHLKRSTQDEYALYVRKHLAPYFGGSQMKAISPQFIQRYVTLKLDSGLAPKSVRNHLVVLSSIFHRAVAWDYVATNPMSKDRVEWPKKPYAAVRYLSVEEVQRLLAATDLTWRTIFLTEVMTGLRMGEIRALRWGDIDFELGRIHVAQDLYKNEADTLKSEKSRRTIPVSPRLLSALFDRKLDAPASAMDLVFCKPDGAPITPYSIRAALKKALTAAGLERIRFHDLRKTFSTVLVQLGENPKVVQELLGHADVNLTMSIYTAAMPDTKVSAIGRLESAFFDD